MRRLILAGLLITVATGALAQARPNTLAMTCAQAAGLVASRGVILLGTGVNTWDRFVSGGQACERQDTTEPAFEQTRDNPQCFIGYRCKPFGRNYNFGR